MSQATARVSNVSQPITRDSVWRTVEIGQDKKRLMQFIRMPYAIYERDPAYVAQLEIERKMVYDRAKNPFFKHAEMELFLCLRGEEVVGRISAQIDHEHLRIHKDGAGFFGSFECIDDAGAAQALFAAACAWLAQRGMKLARGPYTTNINDEAGLLVDGFDTMPMFMMAHHRPYYQALVEGAGLTKVKQLYAWKYGTDIQIPELAQRMAARARRNPKLRVRPIDMKKFDVELRTGLEIFNDAWKDNWGFVPLTEAEMRKAAQDIKLIMDPRIILVAEYEGTPVGMALSIPNINRVIQPMHGKLLPFGWARLLWGTKVQRPDECRLTLLGLRPEFRGLRAGGGLSVLLYVEVYERGAAAGYKHAELSWTLEDNVGINNGIEMMGGRIYKRYNMYERAL